MKYLPTLALALALTSSAASANGYTAAELLNDCRGKKAVCATYAAATWDTFVALSWTHKERVNAGICIPHHVTIAPVDLIKLTEEVVKSQGDAMPAATAILAGMRSRFSCF